MATQPLSANATAAPLPRRGWLPRVWRRLVPGAGMALLWIATLIFLLQAFFHLIRFQHTRAELLEREAVRQRELQKLADWKQKAAFAHSPDFLDSAVKELTLTRDPSEIEIQVQPSPVPPVEIVR